MIHPNCVESANRPTSYYCIDQYLFGRIFCKTRVFYCLTEEATGVTVVNLVVGSEPDLGIVVGGEIMFLFCHISVDTSRTRNQQQNGSRLISKSVTIIIFIPLFHFHVFNVFFVEQGVDSANAG